MSRKTLSTTQSPARLRVLITRPKKQADELVEKLQQKGMETIAFPTIEILPPDEASNLAEQLSQCTQLDIIIFISPNAVDETFKIISPETITKNSPLFACIGSGTQKALKKYGISATVYPKSKFNSEGLLAHPALQEVTQQQIMLIRGQAGRTLLADTLRERGAMLHEMIVYKRVLPNYSQSELDHHLLSTPIDIIIVTSCVALQHLLELTARLDDLEITASTLLVSSDRIANLAKESGFKQIILSKNAGTTAIIEALETPSID